MCVYVCVCVIAYIHRGALGLMYAAEIIFGLGLAIPYSIGLTYVEENAAVHKSSFYGGRTCGC